MVWNHVPEIVGAWKKFVECIEKDMLHVLLFIRKIYIVFSNEYETKKFIYVSRWPHDPYFAE